MREMIMERLNVMDSVVASLKDGEATFIMTASPKGEEYVYSVGVSVSTDNAFEIAITGLSPEQMHFFGNHFAQHIKERVIELDEPITYVEEVFNVPVALVKVSQEYMHDGTFTVAETTLDMTDKQIPMFQLVLPDPNGRFPWQEHVDSKWKKYQSIFFDVQQIENLYN